MSSAFCRSAAFLGVLGALAFTVPAQATHNGTCEGFEDPQCNVDYFVDHSVEPTTQPFACALDGAVELACLVSFIPPEVWETYEEIRDDADRLVHQVERAIGPVTGAVDEVMCNVFGAC